MNIDDQEQEVTTQEQETETAETNSEPENTDAEQAEVKTEAEQETVAEEVSEEVETPEEDAEIVVSFGDEDPDEGESKGDDNWIKDLRKSNRRLARENAELKKSQTAKSDEDAQLGARPTMETCEFNEDKFAEELGAWQDEKRKIDKADQDAKVQSEKQDQAWADRKAEFNDGKKSFDEDAYEDSENAVKAALSETQQGIMVHAFGKDAATMVFGLGTNPEQLKALADIDDPVQFAVAITRLESKMKVKPKKPKTTPETKVSGATANVDLGKSKLEKLEDEAVKTGNVTKLNAYKRQMKQAS